MSSHLPSRRQIMWSSLAGVAAASLVGSTAAHAEQKPAVQVDKSQPWHGLKVGVASYTFKQAKLEPTIAAIKRVGLAYVSIKDFHLPLRSTADERKEVAKAFRDAGIEPLSCGVIALPNKPEPIQQAFEYARDAGIPTIVASPARESLPEVEKLVKQFDIKVAIHNHGPEDKAGWPSPYEVWEGVKNFDPRIGLCIDVGHAARAGADPAQAIRDCAPRVYDIHMKDLSVIETKSKVCEVGRGVLDIRGMFQALLDIKFQGAVSFEYEKDMNDPLPGLAESVGFCRATCLALKPMA